MFARFLLLAMVAGPFAQAECTSPGKERWDIKSSVPAGANLDKPKRVKLTDLVKLKNPPGVTNKDKDFADKRIPAFENPLGVKEGDLVSVTGFLFLVATEDNDCEYHIQISATVPDFASASSSDPVILEDSMIVEVARPDAIADAKLRQAVEDTRAFIRDKLKIKNGKGGNEPSGRGILMTHPVFVRVSGQLFFDDAHLLKDGGSQARGKRGLRTNTLWELHPVYAISFAKKP
jgi:hypothetical protein